MTYAEIQLHLNCLRRKWHNMKQLCYGNGNRDRTDWCYKDKGIGVCDEWNNSFEAFFDWSIANGYKPGMKLERIDKDVDFTPDNCRWVEVLDKSKDTRDILASNLRTCRVRAGKSLRTVGKEIGASAAVMSNWELDKSSPNVVWLRKLADYYGVDVGDLLDKNLAAQEGSECRS